jgi:hypothetical protein
MVNTFITYQKKNGNEFIPDYRKTAWSLDKRRLLKQCVEAYQILNILRHLKKVAKLEGWELYSLFNDGSANSSPKNIYFTFLERVEWSQTIRKKYLGLDYRYAKINGKIQKFPKNKLPIKIKDGTFKIENNCGTIISTITILKTGQKFSRNDVILPGDEIYTLGFSQHAIVKMWIGYEESLKDYINSCIDEYSTRKKKDGTFCHIKIPKYTISQKINHPWWLVYYNGVILSHRSALLRKEYFRKEIPHYFKNKDFTNIPDEWKICGYVWMGSLQNPELILDILEKKKYISPSLICAEVTEKAKDKYVMEEGFVKLYFS